MLVMRRPKAVRPDDLFHVDKVIDGKTMAADR